MAVKKYAGDFDPYVNYGITGEKVNNKWRLTSGAVDTDPTWVAPSYWPTYTVGSNEIVGLYAIRPGHPNIVSFNPFLRNSGTITIDWGDGSAADTRTYTVYDGYSLFHIYDYNNANLTDVTAQCGYKIAKISITATANFGAMMGISTTHPMFRQTNVQSCDSGWIDLTFSGNFAAIRPTREGFGSASFQGNLRHTMLQRLRLFGMSGTSLTDGSNWNGNFTEFLNNCYNLKYFSATGHASGGNFGYDLLSGFANCRSMSTFIWDPPPVPRFFSNAFINCASLPAPPSSINFQTSISSNTAVTPFSGCESFRTVKLNYTISGFGSSLSSWFSGCKDLTYISFSNSFNSITNLSNTFNNCYTLRTVVFQANLPLSNTRLAFNNCYSLIKTPPTCNMVSVTDAMNMYSNCGNLKVVTPFVSNVAAADFSSMFSNCTSLTEVSNIQINGANAIISNMFSNTAIESISMAAKFRNFNSAFAGLKQLKTIEFIGSTNIAQASYAFANCSSLTSIPANIDFSNCANLTGTFSFCSQLKTVANLNIPVTTTINSMFQNCTDLTSVSLSNSNLVTGWANAFSNCTSLQSIAMNTDAIGGNYTKDWGNAMLGSSNISDISFTKFSGNNVNLGDLAVGNTILEDAFRKILPDTTTFNQYRQFRATNSAGATGEWGKFTLTGRMAHPNTSVSTHEVALNAAGLSNVKVGMYAYYNTWQLAFAANADIANNVLFIPSPSAANAIPSNGIMVQLRISQYTTAIRPYLNGITPCVPYYVINSGQGPNANCFQLSTSIGGSPITLSQGNTAGNTTASLWFRPRQQVTNIEASSSNVNNVVISMTQSPNATNLNNASCIFSWNDWLWKSELNNITLTW